MIDLHVHILYGLDDGPETLEESLAMARMGYEDGTKTIVATPHTLNGLYRNERSNIVSRVQELNDALLRFGLLNEGFQNSNSEIRNPKFEIKILPGSDVHLCEETLSEFDEGKVLTIGDGGKFILIEFPSQTVPYQAEEILRQFLKRDVIPVISHPERNLELGRKTRRFSEMIRLGCLGQVTAGSLTGGFGPDLKRIAEQMVRERLIHLIASDAHSINGRPPILSDAVKAATRLVGEIEALKMVLDNPQAILDGHAIKNSSLCHLSLCH